MLSMNKKYKQSNHSCESNISWNVASNVCFQLHYLTSFIVNLFGADGRLMKTYQKYICILGVKISVATEHWHFV